MQKASHENDPRQSGGPPKPVVERDGRAAKTVLCPSCHSHVSSEAGRCPFCNAWLDQRDRANKPCDQPRHSRSWTVIVENQTYGPYDLGEMQDLIAERRVAPHSYVSGDGGATMQKAADDFVLAALLDAAKAVSTTPFEDANSIELTTAPESDGRGGSASRKFSRYMIAADVKWSISRFETALFALGPSYQVMELVWICYGQGFPDGSQGAGPDAWWSGPTVHRKSDARKNCLVQHGPAGRAQNS